MDWLMGVVGLVLTLGLMWSAYCAGSLQASIRCRRLLRESHEAQRRERVELVRELTNTGLLPERSVD